jgi:uncharacterized membrane protein YqjE
MVYSAHGNRCSGGVCWRRNLMKRSPDFERRPATAVDLFGASAAPGVIARAGLWSVLAFVLNLVWEMAHVKLYSIGMQADSLRIAQAVLHCSLGDVVIALAMFALAGIVLWRADWPVSRPWSGGIMIVIGAIAFTAWSEWYNVYRAGSWGYTASMPLIFGIGLSPLLQWLILPPLMVGAYRKLGPLLFRRHSAPTTRPTQHTTARVDN